MLKYSELQKNVTKVLLPNGCTGVVTEISPIKTMDGGLLRGRDKVKVAYTTKTGNTEAWFQLRQLQTYTLVVKKVNTDIQPVPVGKESWKSEDTFNGTEIVEPRGKTEEVIVPDGKINELFKVDEKAKIDAFVIDEEASKRVEKLMKDNKEVLKNDIGEGTDESN